MAYYECINSVEKTQTVSKTLSYPRFGGGAVDFIFDNLSEVKGIISSTATSNDSRPSSTIGILSLTISKNIIKISVRNGDSDPRSNNIAITAIGY